MIKTAASLRLGHGGGKHGDAAAQGLRRRQARGPVPARGDTRRPGPLLVHTAQNHQPAAHSCQGRQERGGRRAVHLRHVSRGGPHGPVRAVPGLAARRVHRLGGGRGRGEEFHQQQQEEQTDQEE